MGKNGGGIVVALPAAADCWVGRGFCGSDSANPFDRPFGIEHLKEADPVDEVEPPDESKLISPHDLVAGADGPQAPVAPEAAGNAVVDQVGMGMAAARELVEVVVTR